MQAFGDGNTTYTLKNLGKFEASSSFGKCFRSTELWKRGAGLIESGFGATPPRNGMRDPRQNEFSPPEGLGFLTRQAWHPPSALRDFASAEALFSTTLRLDHVEHPDFPLGLIVQRYAEVSHKLPFGTLRYCAEPSPGMGCPGTAGRNCGAGHLPAH